MRKSVVFLTGLVLFLFLTTGVQAATITGTVLDEQTGLGVDGYIYAYKDNSYIGSQSVSKTHKTFTFNDLPAGTYHFYTYANMYVTEYYNNTTLYSKRSMVIVTADQTKSLGTIRLRPLPVRLTNFQIIGSPVPATGGTIQVQCDVVNDTAVSKKILVWSSIVINRTIYNMTGTSSQIDGPRKSVTVGPKTKTPVTLSVNIPANAPGGSWHNIYLNCGFSKWLPLMPGNVDAGSFTKLK